jgi:hypothetical protein
MWPRCGPTIPSLEDASDWSVRHARHRCSQRSGVDLEPDRLPVAVLIGVDTPARGLRGHQPKPPAGLLVPATRARLLGKLRAAVMDLDPDGILANKDDQADPSGGRGGVGDRIGDQLFPVIAYEDVG